MLLLYLFYGSNNRRYTAALSAGSPPLLPPSAFCNNDMQIVQKVGAEWRRGKPKELKAKAKGIRDAQAAQAAAARAEKKDKANSNNL